MALRHLSLVPNFIDTGTAERFNRFDRLISQMTADEKRTSPPSYDFYRKDETNYELTVSIPGWTQEELEVEMVGSQLTINGRKHTEETEPKEGKGNWIHRGINHSDFQLSYSLPEKVKVTGAKLEHGLLSVQLYQEIPESEKPRKISINSGSGSPSEGEREVIEHNPD
ncbi:Hsp20 family protein [Pantoea sp. BAV 3049]|uniref:Hsp20 family protein n=1 Tax=Pantoea sp. BAV 3049 TaxID=2654188 RepID=UPI00131D50A2|nr:Hsp20 family protein [Pantoea sp. BAV 3049]